MVEIKEIRNHLSFLIGFSGAFFFVSRADLSLIGVDGAAETKRKLVLLLFFLWKLKIRFLVKSAREQRKAEKLVNLSLKA